MKVDEGQQVILIVDDKPANLDVIRAFLKEHNFRILVANSGAGALSRIEHIRPDLILLDVLMPGIDGFETCRRIKARKEFQDIPVIFMSALTDTEHKTEGFSVGAVDFITKPIQREELLARVNTHLEIMRYRIHLEDEVARRTVELEREIGERKKSEEEYRLLFNNASDAILIVSGGLCIKCNIKALELFNCKKDDIIGAAPFASFLPDRQPDGRERGKVIEDILNFSYERLELILIRGGSRAFLAELSISPLTMLSNECLQIIVHDISEKRKLKEMEAALIQSSKLAEIGALTAGIVHEIKNPLAGIEQTGQNIRIRLFDESIVKNLTAAEEVGISFSSLKEFLYKRKIDEMLADVSESCARMRKIISNMLTFSRKTQLSYDRYNIKELFHETLILAKFNHDFARIKDVTVEEEDEMPSIYCVKNEIEQVFLNVLNNGAQAMIEYKKVKGGYNPAFKIKLYSDESDVYIDFEDNGPGIDEEIIDKIFELFFTTKSVERGTGLGLYICKQIIEENHNGSLCIKSRPGSGASVSIRLPIKRPDIE